MRELQFYIDDHALLFAWLTRALLQGEPEKGLGLAEEWVTLYGRERGARSARRCLNDGQDLSLQNYFVYSEWYDERGWNRNRTVSLAPYHFHTTECGWNKIWREHNMLEYGSLYCRWIDYALVQGFNPELGLEMSGTLSEGGEYCSFAWPGEALDEAGVAEMQSRRATLYPKVTRDFLYHLAHLYDALRRVLIPRLGFEAAERILLKGRSEYSAAFGENKIKAVLRASQQNFSML